MILSKRPQKLKKTVEGATLSLNGSKDNRPDGWFPGAGVPESAVPKYAHVTKEEKGPPKEREKQRKKERQVQRYEGKVYECMAMAMARTRVLKRDLNTLEAKAWRITSKITSNNYRPTIPVVITARPNQ